MRSLLHEHDYDYGIADSLECFEKAKKQKSQLPKNKQLAF